MILEVNHLSKKIGNKTILDDLSFNIYENEIVGFIGPNGAGKSTTLKCISGLYYATSGSIKINGYDIKKQHALALRDLGISIENPALYPNLSGYDHLKLMAGWHGLDDARIKEMERYSGIDKMYLKQKVTHYSLGMKQRLMLSLVMMPKPKLLILDEPCNGLDPEAVFALREKLVEIRENGSSILFSSHQLSEMEKIADRVIFIKNGKIVDNILIDKIRKLDLKYELLVDSAKEAIAACGTIDGLICHVKSNNEIAVELQSQEVFSHMIMALNNAGNKIYNVRQNQMTLEDYYKRLYKDNADEKST